MRQPGGQGSRKRVRRREARLIGCVCCILIVVIVYSGFVVATLVDPAHYRRNPRNPRVRLESPNLFGEKRSVRWEDLRFRVQRLRFKVDALSTYLEHYRRDGARGRTPVWEEPPELNLTCGATADLRSRVKTNGGVQKMWMHAVIKAYRKECLGCHLAEYAAYAHKNRSKSISVVYSREIRRSVKRKGEAVHGPSDVEVVVVCLLLHLDNITAVKRLAIKLKQLESETLAVVLVVVMSPTGDHVSDPRTERLKEVTGVHGEVVRLLYSPKRNVTDAWLVNFAMAYAYTIELSSYFVYVEGSDAAEGVLDGVWKLQTTDGQGAVYAADAKNRVVQLTTSRLHLSRHRVFFPLPGELSNMLRWIIMLHPNNTFALGKYLLDVNAALRDQKEEPYRCLMLEYVLRS